ncbi:MAG TPA: 4Fe-4S binding protein [Atribacterota bacterium]|nr:4Fe-4S binding protein [Atribacterota bacterium]
MRINPDKCIGCEKCIIYCPLNCIVKEDKKCKIDEDECVDCGVCKRANICPTDAIFMPRECFDYPRAVRMQFSDPCAYHPSMKSFGRGTEEAKTNDVTGKFKKGEYGLLLEFGRPCVGVRLSEIEKVTVAMRTKGLPILEENPLFGLLEEDDSGHFKKEYVNEKLLSAILETRFKEDELETIIRTILPLLDNLSTVVSVGLVTRFANDGSLPIIKKLEDLNMNIRVRPNAKINVGLGRPLID